MTDYGLSELMASAVADVTVTRNLAHEALAGGKRRQRRRRRRFAGATAAGVIGVAVVLAAVATGRTTGGSARLIPAGPSGPERSPSAPIAPPPSTTCPTPLPAAWTSRLHAGKIPLPPSLSALPFAISPGGTHVYAGVTGPDWSGMAAISRDGGMQRIHSFATSTAQVVSGGASERFVVWVESYSPTDLSNSAMFSWDAASGTVQELAAPPAGSGPTLPMPQSLPVVQGNQATWVDSLDGVHDRVHLYDLARRTDQIVFTGHAITSTLAGKWLVWTGGRPNQPATLHLVDVETGAALPTPAALATVAGVSAVAGSDGTLTWIGADNRTVYTWQAGMTGPRRLFYAGSGDFADFPVASGQYAVWDAADAAYIADVTTGGVATLSTTPTQPVIRGSFVVLNTGPGNTAKVAHPVRSVNVLDTSGLPALAGCKVAGQ